MTDCHQEFDLLMRYLTNSAGDEALYRHYSRLREHFPQTVSSKKISGCLAECSLQNRLTLALGDVWTRLFDSQNILRYKLTAVLAVAECHPLIYGQWDKPKSLWPARFELVWILAHYGLTLTAAILWVPLAVLWRSFRKS